MDASNGMITVEVRLGRPVYRGRAVAGGELVYRPEDNAWLQVVKDKGRSASGWQSPFARLLRTPAFLVAATLLVSLVAVVVVVTRKPISGPDIKVAEFKQSAVELVDEPFHGMQQPTAVSDAAASAALPVPAYKAEVAPGLVPAPTAKTERLSAQPTPAPTRSQAQDHPAQAPSEPSRGASAPTQEAFVLLNRANEAPASKAVPAAKPLRLVAVADENTIVLSNPQNGVPVPFKIGARLFDGSVLKSVDLRSGSATTDKGVLKLE
jgi:outer membrane biosynthesis protein TonB